MDENILLNHNQNTIFPQIGPHGTVCDQCLLKRYTKILDKCCHTICGRCLRSNTQSDGAVSLKEIEDDNHSKTTIIDTNKFIRCCRCEISSPLFEQTNASFPINYACNKVLFDEEKISLESGCAFCHKPDVAALGYCIQCEGLLCTDCSQVHQSSGDLRHDFHLIDNEASVMGSSMCRHHAGKASDILCDTCQIPICTLCVMSSHKGHGFRRLPDTTNAHIKNEMSYYENINSILSDTMINLEEYSSKLKEITKNLVSDASTASTRVKSTYAAYFKLIEDQKNQLLRDIENGKFCELDKIESFSKEIDIRQHILARLREIMLKNWNLPNKMEALDLLNRLRPTICEHLSIQYPNCQNFQSIHYQPPTSIPAHLVNHMGTIQIGSFSQLPKSKLALVTSSIRSGSDCGFGPVGGERRRLDKLWSIRHASSTGNIKEDLNNHQSLFPAAKSDDWIDDDMGSMAASESCYDEKENQASEMMDLGTLPSAVAAMTVDSTPARRAITGGNSAAFGAFISSKQENGFLVPNGRVQPPFSSMQHDQMNRMMPTRRLHPSNLQSSSSLSSSSAGMRPPMSMLARPASSHALEGHKLGSLDNIPSDVSMNPDLLISSSMMSEGSGTTASVLAPVPRIAIPGVASLVPRCMDRVTVEIRDQLAHCMRMTHQYGFTNLPRDGLTDFYGIAQRLQTMLTSNETKIMETIPRVKMVYINKWGEWGVTESQFSEPNGVAVLPNYNITVADTNSHRIQVFTREGNFAYQFSVTNRDEGVSYPNCIAVNRLTSEIVITERSPNHQVQVYTASGHFVRRFGSEVLESPRGVAVDKDGRILVVECKVMRVSIFSPEGSLITQFQGSRMEFPNSIAVDDRYRIYISDNRAHCIRLFNYFGDKLGSIGCLGLTNYPIGVAINSEGNIVVADNHNNFNVTVFNRNGYVMQALESRVKHAQCYDMALLPNRGIVLTSKDYRVYCYELPPF